MPPQILVCDDDIGIRDIVKIALSGEDSKLWRPATGWRQSKLAEPGLLHA
jgi:hypothetical protein